jgi:cytochrome c peroxidase
VLHGANLLIKLLVMNKSTFTLFLLAAASASAQMPVLYDGADLKLGGKLMADKQCLACHQQKVGGDGSAIYKPAGRINTPGLLRGMVEQCNMELNIGLFPDEVNSIAAVLNRDHYKFK